MAKKRKAASPYQKYGKSPFRYSTLYYQWRDAVKRNDTAAMRTLGRQHSIHFLGADEYEAARKRLGTLAT